MANTPNIGAWANWNIGPWQSLTETGSEVSLSCALDVSSLLKCVDTSIINSESKIVILRERIYNIEELLNTLRESVLNIDNNLSIDTDYIFLIDSSIDLILSIIHDIESSLSISLLKDFSVSSNLGIILNTILNIEWLLIESTICELNSIFNISSGLGIGKTITADVDWGMKVINQSVVDLSILLGLYYTLILNYSDKIIIDKNLVKTIDNSLSVAGNIIYDIEHKLKNIQLYISTLENLIDVNLSGELNSTSLLNIGSNKITQTDWTINLGIDTTYNIGYRLQNIYLYLNAIENLIGVNSRGQLNLTPLLNISSDKIIQIENLKNLSLSSTLNTDWLLVISEILRIINIASKLGIDKQEVINVEWLLLGATLFAADSIFNISNLLSTDKITVSNVDWSIGVVGQSTASLSALLKLFASDALNHDSGLSVNKSAIYGTENVLQILLSYFNVIESLKNISPSSQLNTDWLLNIADIVNIINITYGRNINRQDIINIEWLLLGATLFATDNVFNISNLLGVDKTMTTDVGWNIGVAGQSAASLSTLLKLFVSDILNYDSELTVNKNGVYNIEYTRRILSSYLNIVENIKRISLLSQSSADWLLRILDIINTINITYGRNIDKQTIENIEWLLTGSILFNTANIFDISYRLNIIKTMLSNGGWTANVRGQSTTNINNTLKLFHGKTISYSNGLYLLLDNKYPVGTGLNILQNSTFSINWLLLTALVSNIETSNVDYLRQITKLVTQNHSHSLALIRNMVYNIENIRNIFVSYMSILEDLLKTGQPLEYCVELLKWLAINEIIPIDMGFDGIYVTGYWILDNLNRTWTLDSLSRTWILTSSKI